MMSNYIVLLVGKSGSGKTTISEELERLYHWKSLQSYTTRPKRNPNETGHTFITDAEFDELKDICAYTEFDKHRYCATKQQIDEADVYVIDPDGVYSLRDNYDGDKLLIPIYLQATEDTLYERMRTRGDSWVKAKRRIKHDRKVFAEFEEEAPLRINAEWPLKDVVERIYQMASMISAVDKIAKERRGNSNEEVVD